MSGALSILKRACDSGRENGTETLESTLELVNRGCRVQVGDVDGVQVLVLLLVLVDLLGRLANAVVSIFHSLNVLAQVVRSVGAVNAEGADTGSVVVLVFILVAVWAALVNDCHLDIVLLCVKESEGG